MEDGFVVFLACAALVTGILVGIMLTTEDGKHVVGMNHRACMEIIRTDTQVSRACILGEDLLKVLRQREGY